VSKEGGLGRIWEFSGILLLFGFLKLLCSVSFFTFLTPQCSTGCYLTLEKTAKFKMGGWATLGGNGELARGPVSYKKR